MPRCDGRPDPVTAVPVCPLKMNNSTVKLCQGDLMLCKECEDARFSNTGATTKITVSAGPSTSTARQQGTTTQYASSNLTSTATTPTAPEQAEPEMLIDNILCFFTCKSLNQPKGSLKSTAAEYFREDEITKSKLLLVKAVEKLELPGLQQYIKVRKGENKNKSNIDDIVNILETVDENGQWTKMPVFCANDVSRIPQIDDISLMAVMRKDIDNLMAMVANVRDTIDNLLSVCSNMHISLQSQDSPQKKILSDLYSVCSNVQMQLNSQSHRGNQYTSALPADDQQNHHSSSTLTTTSYSGAVTAVSSGIYTSHSNPSQKPSQAPMLRSSSAASYLSVNPSTMASEQQEQSSSESAGVLIAGSGQPTTLDTDSQASANMYEWQQQKSRKTKKKKLIEGRSDNSKLKGVVRKAIYCVNRLSPDTTTDDVCDFLSSCGIKVLSCYSLNHVDSDDLYYVSMRVCIGWHDRDLFLQNDLWPAGVTVRPWVFKTKPVSN